MSCVCLSNAQCCLGPLATTRLPAISLLTLCFNARSHAIPEPTFQPPPCGEVTPALRACVPQVAGTAVPPSCASRPVGPAMLATSPPWGPSSPPPTAAPPATQTGLQEARSLQAGLGCLGVGVGLGNPSKGFLRRCGRQANPAGAVHRARFIALCAGAVRPQELGCPMQMHQSLPAGGKGRHAPCTPGQAPSAQAMHGRSPHFLGVAWGFCRLQAQIALPRAVQDLHPAGVAFVLPLFPRG